MAVLVILEIVFRVLPVSTVTRNGYYIHPLIVTYPPHHCFTIATGWDLKNAQRNCSNNLGFLADRDFVQDPRAIALIGDSFVEANMLPAKDRLAAQLEAELAGRPVYSMGGPGSNLLDYAERAKFAAEKFGTRTFVFVLERGDIRQSICGSGNVHGVCLDAKSLTLETHVLPPPSSIKRFVRESALAQYVFSQIKFDTSKLISRLLQTESIQNRLTAKPLPLETSSKVVRLFFERISGIREARFLFLIDADRTQTTETPLDQDDELAVFARAAVASQAPVIDPTREFGAFVRTSGRALEVGPYDHHWNASAVHIVASLISRHF